MRTQRLKEKDTDLFLRLEPIKSGALLVVEESGDIVSQFTLTLRQMANMRDWLLQQSTDIIKDHKVSSK